MPVTQADRARAVRIMSDKWHPRHREEVLAGKHDDWIPVQECAAHRLAALDEAAGVIENVEPLPGYPLADDDHGAFRYALDIARADILALKGKSDD